MISADPGGSTRIRSIRAALEVVREEGFDRLTTRAIARRTGLTQPAIYRHFAGKDELVRDVLAEIRDRFASRAERALERADPLSRLIATLESFRSFAIDEPRLYDALFIHSRSLRIPPGPKARSFSVFGFLVERVAECGRAGILPAERPVATALSLAAHAQGLILLNRQGRFASEERFRAFFHESLGVLLQGLVQGQAVHDIVTAASQNVLTSEPP